MTEDGSAAPEIEGVAESPELGAARPWLRIERGNPDEAELAALTVTLAGLAAAGQQRPTREPARMSVWADRASALRYPGGRRPLRPGPHAWRASALPG
ncbi:acyl-CoA carboxylase subunit epsilon [Actinopolyspora mortivallis]|uniref:acyl-CoA carboxylase subunit epsilon n=1 Tax=Actinopolyspora mortivallis TaxID=33906 RepID=UPI002158B059|nr:acyl-CoA carboxylase subunit epsilon [Actinopolyspora mortivallis]